MPSSACSSLIKGGDSKEIVSDISLITHESCLAASIRYVRWRNLPQLSASSKTHFFDTLEFKSLCKSIQYKNIVKFSV